MGNPVVHFEIIGRDAQALQTFYQRAFDWEIGEPMTGSPVSYRLAFPRAKGTMSGIDGGIGGGMDGYDGHATFYVAVPDLDAHLEKVTALGASIVIGPEEVPGGPRIALIRDPEGHLLGLVQGSPEAPL